jgi:hypothetical protein
MEFEVVIHRANHLTQDRALDKKNEGKVAQVI